MIAPRHDAFVLVGPTATGKTAVAQLLAEQLNAAVLSADAMLVYRGMDIGTAKPSAIERSHVRYGGLDLVDPGENFDVATWLAHARKFLAQARATGQPVIVVGGTGLYIKCLLTGLTVQPSADPVWRAAATRMNLAELQTQLQKLDAARFAAMTESDQQNPRRLIRAVELARGTPSPEESATATPAPLEKAAAGRPIPGLQLQPTTLAQRIELRTDSMFRNGLPAEARRLCEKFPQLSATARQAIGYAEVFAMLDGRCTEAEARAKIAARTRQLAKRQMTWFKHQASVDWVAAEGSVAEVASRIHQIWKKNGPTPLAY